MRSKMILRDNFKKYRHIALCMIGIMVIGLYGLVITEPYKTVSLVKTAEELPHKFIKKNYSVKSSLKTQKFIEGMKFNNINVIKVAAESLNDLQSIFLTCNYDVSKVRKGNIYVPRLFLTNLPSDMGTNRDIETRKNTFILSILPMVLQANEKIQEKRKKLLKISSQFFLTPEDKVWLQKLATQYNLKNIDIEELKKRVDIVPPSLFLAQAIIETGWGTSNAALTKKSLFGVTLKSGVKQYSTLEESVDAYIHNLNYNSAYKEMRTLRHEMRLKNLTLCSHQLIGKLIRYCEKRMWYVQKVRKTIHNNNLKQFDNSILEHYNA